MWLVQWLIQGLALAAVATAAARLVPVTSPRQRHLFWWLVLAAVMALPWLPAPFVAPDTTVVALATPPRALALEVTAPPAWIAVLCLAVWGAVTFTSLVSLLIDLRALRFLKRRTRPLSQPDALPLVTQMHAVAAGVRGTRVVLSDDVGGACAAGYLAPCVIVSSRLAASLRPSALESVVHHELAHLARYDDWLRLLQRFVLAGAGLHPAVRWISRQIDIEREAACDRLVVERTGDPLGYARALTSVAELMAECRHGAPRLAPGASMTGAGLHARVQRLLGAREADGRRVPMRVAASVASLVVAVVGVASAPPLVVVASLEPLRALNVLPAGRALWPRLPELEARVMPTASSTPAAVIPPQPEAQHGTAPEVSARSGEAPPAEQVIDGTVAEADPLEVPVRRELGMVTEPEIVPRSGVAATFGARAARAGSATGSTAARTGAVIGRLFSNGGRAVAGRF